MTAPQTPQPLPEPMHVMTVAAWKRCIAAHIQLQAALARKESTNKEKQ